MKRIFDIVASLLGLIIFFPIMLIVALIVKITSPGLILFSQKRLAMGMREFNIYKFRSIFVRKIQFK